MCGACASAVLFYLFCLSALYAFARGAVPRRHRMASMVTRDSAAIHGTPGPGSPVVLHAQPPAGVRRSATFTSTTAGALRSAPSFTRRATFTVVDGVVGAMKLALGVSNP